MVSPSFAIRDPRGRAPFPSRSRLCRSARGARVYNRRLVRGNFKTEFYGHESEVHDSSKTPRAMPYGQTVLPESRITAPLAKLISVRRIIISAQLRAPRQVAAPRTRAEGRTSPARENTRAARPSRRIREDSGRTLGRDNRERRGFGTGEKTVWASSETTPVTPWWIARPRSRPSVRARGRARSRGEVIAGPTPADCNPGARPRPLSIVTKNP